MDTVRRLNQEGRLQFKEWLEKGAPSPAPFALLTNPLTSESIEGQAYVEMRPFDTRLAFGEYLADRFHHLPAVTLRFDEGLWDWLSLYYIDQLLPPNTDGHRKVREIVRYALELKNRKWSRHLVRTSWMAVKDHGAYARVMLTVPVSIHNDVVEQIGGQQESFGARSVVQLADYLYFDADAGKLKTGTQGKKGGVPRRLVRFLRQIRCTYDPPEMSVDQLLSILPPEFERWHQSESVRAPTSA